jgi:hypothetical protein
VVKARYYRKGRVVHKRVQVAVLTRVVEFVVVARNRVQQQVLPERVVNNSLKAIEHCHALSFPLLEDVSGVEDVFNVQRFANSKYLGKDSLDVIAVVVV